MHGPGQGFVGLGVLWSPGGCFLLHVPLLLYHGPSSPSVCLNVVFSLFPSPLGPFVLWGSPSLSLTHKHTHTHTLSTSASAFLLPLSGFLFLSSLFPPPPHPLAAPSLSSYLSIPCLFLSTSLIFLVPCLSTIASPFCLHLCLSLHHFHLSLYFYLSPPTPLSGYVSLHQPVQSRRPGPSLGGQGLAE